jgi:hypothetical protein
MRPDEYHRTKSSLTRFLVPHTVLVHRCSVAHATDSRWHEGRYRRLGMIDGEPGPLLGELYSVQQNRPRTDYEVMVSSDCLKSGAAL